MSNSIRKHSTDEQFHQRGLLMSHTKMHKVTQSTAKGRCHHTPVRKMDPTAARTKTEGDRRIGPSKGSEVWRAIRPSILRVSP